MMACAVEPVEVRVRQTAGGPRIFVDGKPVRPRLYYGSPTCLAAISEGYRTTFTVPFRADADTRAGCVRLETSADEQPIWFSQACSTGNSYGCDPCWRAPGEPDDFSPIDGMVRTLVAANPNVLVVPRVNADAPPLSARARTGSTMRCSRAGDRTRRRSRPW